MWNLWIRGWDRTALLPEFRGVERLGFDLFQVERVKKTVQMQNICDISKIMTKSELRKKFSKYWTSNLPKRSTPTLSATVFASRFFSAQLAVFPPENNWLVWSGLRALNKLRNTERKVVLCNFANARRELSSRVETRYAIIKSITVC